jgi:(2R)-sulfolactate sulfo-lyase subunit beta
MPGKKIPKTIWGYRRENGRVGIRNHVVILPLDDLSNAACEAVAHNIKGTLALPHHYGRLQFGEDLQLHFRTLIGTGCNPNVAAVVVIGIEPGWTGRVVDGIAATGKPVQGFSIERNGDIKTIAAASRVAHQFLQHASELQREECSKSHRQAGSPGPDHLLRRDLGAHRCRDGVQGSRGVAGDQ